MHDSPEWRKPTLIGRSVTLRPMTAGDTDVLWEMVNEPVGRDLTATTEDFTYEQIREWSASREAQDGRLDLLIVDTSTGECVGEAVLNEYDPADSSANFRISLRGPSWFGRGYGTEATTLIVDHGLSEVGLSRIHLGVLARNPRAVRTYERVGFRHVGTMHEDGETWITMEITSADRAAARERENADEDVADPNR